VVQTRARLTTQSKSSKYKLVYFDGMGRGEIIRLLFHASGQQFEDSRVIREQWAKVKPTLPFKLIPVLEVDGVSLPESHAIERFLAGRFGLNGSTDLESAQIDVIVEWMENLKTAYRKVRDLKVDEEKAAFRKTFFQNEFEPAVNNLESWLSTLGHNKGPWVVGTKLSLADITLYQNLKFYWDDVGKVESALKGKTKILSSLEATAKHPGVSSWIKTRPKSSW